MASRGVTSVPVFYVTDDGIIYDHHDCCFINNNMNEHNNTGKSYDVEESRIRLANVLRTRRQQKQQQQQLKQQGNNNINNNTNNKEIVTVENVIDDDDELNEIHDDNDEVDEIHDHDENDEAQENQSIDENVINNDDDVDDEWCSDSEEDDDNDESDSNDDDFDNEVDDTVAISPYSYLANARTMQSNDSSSNNNNNNNTSSYNSYQATTMVHRRNVESQQQRYISSILQRDQQLKMNQALARTAARNMRPNKGNSSKVLPSQFIYQPSPADNAAARAIVHHTGSHYHMAGGKQYQRGVRVKGTISRHSKQGAKLQAARLAQKNMYDAREDARGERTAGSGRNQMKTKKSKKSGKGTTNQQANTE